MPIQTTENLNNVDENAGKISIIDENEEISDNETNEDDESLYKKIDPVKIINVFGKYGRYQMMTSSFASVICYFFCTNMMVMSFIANEPDFECQHPLIDDGVYTLIDKCTVRDGDNETRTCREIGGTFNYFNLTKDFSLTTSFDLVCEKASMQEHAAGTFMIGNLVSILLLSQISDKYGRKLTFILPLNLSAIPNILALFSPNYYFFLVCRFFSGFFLCGALGVAHTYVLEMVSTEFRDLLPVVPTAAWTAGYMLVGVIRMNFDTWQMVYGLTTCPIVLTFFYFAVLPESPHWLAMNGKWKELRDYVRRAEKFNGVKIDISQCITDDTSSISTVERSMLDVFTNGALLVNFIVVSVIMVTMNLAYWALSLFSTELDQNSEYTGFFLSGLVEVPTGIIGIYLVKKFSRRAVTAYSLAVQAICTLAAVVFPWPGIVFWSPLFAKGANTVAWASMPLHYSEIPPTTVRNVFDGMCAFTGELGGIGAPYLKLLEGIDHSAPTFLICVLTVISATLVYTLPETKLKPLVGDIDDEAFDEGPLYRFIQRQRSSGKNLQNLADVETTPMNEVIVEAKEENS